MTIESGTYISELNDSYPAAGDSKSEGDDHIRKTKLAAKRTFPGWAGAVGVTGVDGGLVNAYTLTPATALPSYTAKTLVEFTPTITNTGAATLNISGLGVKSILSVDGAALVAGDLVAGQYSLAFYDGTAFRLAAITKNYIDQIVVSNTLPGVATPANAGLFYTTDGSVGGWESIDLRGSPVTDKGNSGTTAQVIDYADGEGQTSTATGSHQISTTGWPASRLAFILYRMINGGAYTITSSGITWIKSDGTTTTTFSASGITLQVTGPSMLLFYSFGDGTVYGMAR